MCNRFVVAEARLSATPPGHTAHLIFDLGYASAETAAVARDLAQGMLSQIETLLADPATDLPSSLRGWLAPPARWPSRAPVGPPSPPWTRRWHAPGARIRPGGVGEASR